MTLISLPVAELSAKILFCDALGFIFSTQVPDNAGKTLVLNPTTFAICLSQLRFRGCNDAPNLDAKASGT